MSTLELCPYLIHFNDTKVFKRYFNRTKTTVDSEQYHFIDTIINKLNECILREGTEFVKEYTSFVGKGANGVVFSQILSFDDEEAIIVAIKLEIIQFNYDGTTIHNDSSSKDLLKSINIQYKLSKQKIALTPIFTKQMLILREGRTEVKQEEMNLPYSTLYYGMLAITITGLADCDVSYLFKQDSSNEPKLVSYVDMMVKQVNKLIELSTCIDLKPGNFLYLIDEKEMYVSDIDHRFCKPLSKPDNMNEDVFNMMVKGIQYVIFLFNMLSTLVNCNINPTTILKLILSNKYMKIIYEDIRSKDQGSDILRILLANSDLFKVFTHYSPDQILNNDQQLDFEKFKKWFVDIYKTIYPPSAASSASTSSPLPPPLKSASAPSEPPPLPPRPSNI